MITHESFIQALEGVSNTKNGDLAVKVLMGAVLCEIRDELKQHNRLEATIERLGEKLRKATQVEVWNDKTSTD